MHAAAAVPRRKVTACGRCEGEKEGHDAFDVNTSKSESVRNLALDAVEFNQLYSFTRNQRALSRGLVALERRCISALRRPTV